MKSSTSARTLLNRLLILSFTTALGSMSVLAQQVA